MVTNSNIYKVLIIKKDMEMNKNHLIKLSKEELVRMILDHEKEKSSETIEECRDILRMGVL